MIKIYTYEEKKLDIEQISNLFKKAFNKEFDKEYWRWRFLRNPNSSKIYITYALDGELLVAYYAISPMFIDNNNEVVNKVALSNMTMTHPDYQGQGLFSMLARKLFDKLKQDGFIGIYGFANSNSHYGFRKNLGWRDISALNIFKLKKEDFRTFLIKNNNNYTFKNSEITINSFNKIEQFYRTKQNIKIVLNKDNLIWRFAKNPNNQYFILEITDKDTIVGYIVYKKFGNEIDIMEFWCNSNFKAEHFDTFIAGINQLVSKYSSNINLWSNLYTEEHLILEKYGFKETEFNSYFGFILFNKDTKYLELSNWHYRFTDSDIF